MVENWDGPPTGYNWKQFLANVKLFSFTRLDNRLCKRTKLSIRFKSEKNIISNVTAVPNTNSSKGLGGNKQQEPVGLVLQYLIYRDNNYSVLTSCCLAGRNCGVSFHKQQKILFFSLASFYFKHHGIKENMLSGEKYLMDGQFETSTEKKLQCQPVVGFFFFFF
jgi:hypothetical protein